MDSFNLEKNVRLDSLHLLIAVLQIVLSRKVGFAKLIRTFSQYAENVVMVEFKLEKIVIFLLILMEVVHKPAP